MINKIENHIERLREKPEHVRKRIAFLTSLGVSALIFVFWIASYGLKSTSVAQVPASKTPMESLTASVGDVFTYVKEIFTGSNKAEYAAPEIEVIPGKR
ncbi:MAG: hypothetical protein AAB917_00510 [Patescibacteria group bacterium]